jgi:hypothetical protein
MNEKEKTQIKMERDRIIRKRVEDSKVIDPTVRVRFQNIEDPPAAGRPSPPLSFTYNQYIFKESRTEGETDTALRHGEEYDLPLSVVNHLNTLKVPVYGHKIDPVTRALKSYVVTEQNRFSCVPVDMGKFIQTQAEPNVNMKRGKPIKETNETAQAA